MTLIDRLGSLPKQGFAEFLKFAMATISYTWLWLRRLGMHAHCQGRWFSTIVGCAVLALRSVAQGETNYVSLLGHHQHPFTNWYSAATNIQSAVDAATGGGTVMVTNGVFVLTNEVTVGTNLVICSANGAAGTFVDGGQATRCFRMMPDAGSTLRGFTITNAVAATNESGCPIVHSWAMPPISLAAACMATE
jgi:hypothetical protein